MNSTYESPDYALELTTYADFLEIASGVSGNFPLPSPVNETCKNLHNSRCPVYPYEEIRYTLRMGVLLLYPRNLDLDLRISVRDRANNFHSCFQLLARTSG